MIAILEIKQIRIMMIMGVGAEERSASQEVEFNIEIRFNKLPEACNSDNINDALCYDNLTKVIADFCVKNEFHLIEHLSFALHAYIKDKFLTPKDELALQVCKFAPVEEIKGQSCFTIKN